MRHKGSPNLPEKAQRRAKRLVDLYEREAYKTYNLALRTTGNEQAAASATEVAFLRYVASTASTSDASSVNEQRAALLKEAVDAALAEAPRPTARSRRKGRSDSEKLLAANAALSGPERAAIALISIGEGGDAAIAAATETTQKAAAALAKQARQGIADRSGIAAGQLATVLHDWQWVEPPEEIWEGLYPQAERLLAEVDAPARKEKPAKSARRPSGAARRAVRSAGAGRRKGPSGAARVWAFRAAVLAIVLLPAAVVAMTGESGDSGTSVALSAVGDGSGSASSTSSAENTEGGSTYDALSPKELDQLRLEELEDLRRYSREQADKSLSSGEQADAEAEAQALLELARERLEEAERREQQAATREEQAKAKETPEAPATTPAQPAPAKKKGKKGKRKPPPPSGVSIDDCLFDEQSGTYICPE